jgi:sugar phosphate isomerase/epimerase
MEIGVCTKPAEMTEGVDGLDYIETTVAHLLCPRESDEEFDRRRQAAEAAALPVVAANCLLPGKLKTTGPEVDTAALDEYMETVLRRAEAAGLDTLVYGSGGSRNVPEGFSTDEAAEQIVDHLRRWGPMADDHSVTLVLEPLNTDECNIVNSVRSGAELVRRADHPRVRLLADTYHMAVESEPALNIREAGELLAHAHCADSRGRVPLGFGQEDHGAYFKALKAAGYDGRISIEAKWGNFARQLPRAVAQLREQIDSA